MNPSQQKYVAEIAFVLQKYRQIYIFILANTTSATTYGRL